MRATEQLREAHDAASLSLFALCMRGAAILTAMHQLFDSKAFKNRLEHLKTVSLQPTIAGALLGGALTVLVFRDEIFSHLGTLAFYFFICGGVAGTGAYVWDRAKFLFKAWWN